MGCTSGNWKELLGNGRMLDPLGKYRIVTNKLKWVTEMSEIWFCYW